MAAGVVKGADLAIGRGWSGPMSSATMKVLNTRLYWLRDLMERGEIRVQRAPTEANGANALTKKLTRPQLERERELCGVFRRDAITEEQSKAARQREINLIANESAKATERGTLANADADGSGKITMRLCARLARQLQGPQQ